jgi:pyruvate,water dikinase
LHTVVPADTTWTTVNVSEAMPGVLSPLTWTFWMPAIERGSRRSYRAQGIFPADLAQVPDDPGARFQAVFFGRAALNPDLARLLGDLAPGTDGAATEQRVLGFARDLPSGSTNRRAPAIAWRMPREVRTIDRRVRAVLADTRGWWSRTVSAEPESARAAVELLVEARHRFEDIIELHTTATCIGLLFAESLERMATGNLSPELLDRATSGDGELQELDLVRDLAACARGDLSLSEVVAVHGFHGPDEGQLQSRSWRQDPAQLEPLLTSYRSSPPEVSAGPSAQRATARRELLNAVPRARRPIIRWLVDRSARAQPLREVGKTAFLMAIDVGRHAATVAGMHLHRQGILRNATDVFLLTVDELLAVGSGAEIDGLGDLVEERRDRQVRYERMELPTIWTGQPEPVERTVQTAAEAGVVLTGATGAGGVVEGLVFVAPDLASAFGAEPGHIVVCPVTDPSWASVFPVIDGIVVEVGSHTSHAAIVARELGLPCLVGVERATERLTTGMRVRLDADAGELTVLEGAP